MHGGKALATVEEHFRDRRPWGLNSWVNTLLDFCNEWTPPAVMGLNLFLSLLRLLFRVMSTGQIRQRGFTLIELSIVLVIIGLIAGAVLVGQELIRAAAVRATISQIDKYNTGVYTFREKYGGLPGDLNATSAALFGLVARGQYAGEGDGNGIIEGVWHNSAGKNGSTLEGAGETSVFWVDLSTAGLIEGGFSAASETVVPTSDITFTSTPGINNYFPEAKIKSGSYIYVFSGGITGSDGMNYFGLSLVTVIKNPSNNDTVNGDKDLTVQEAYSIDQKGDDGLPLSGKVTAMYVHGVALYDGGLPNTAIFPWSGSCYDNGGNASAVTHYSVGYNGGTGVNCTLSFQFQ